MNTVLRYVIGLDLLNCHAKFRRDTISHSWENDIWSCYFDNFLDKCIPKLKLSLPLKYIGGRMWRWVEVRLAELPFLLFCKHKTRGEKQFWIELAAPYTLANRNEIKPDDTLPSIIFSTPVSCDGSNCPLAFTLVAIADSPCSLWRHKQNLFSVIWLQAGRKCRTFRRVIDRYHFHRYLCFHCVFCVRVFCILFCKQGDHIVQSRQLYKTVILQKSVI